MNTDTTTLPAESDGSLETIIVAAHRLARVASTITGDTTSPAVWRTLSILRTDGPMRIGALATASRVAQPTMTKLLANIVEQELVYRIADVEDSRAWLIAIAGRGEKALDDYRQGVADALAPLFADLDQADRDALARTAQILEARSSVETSVSAAA
jgi:DNA-binding MarR family transcriptional regulator